MRPGITIQHTSLPKRKRGLVRSDITGMIGFVPPERWSEGTSEGDFLNLRLTRISDFWHHPIIRYISPATQKAVVGFFENGGQILELYAVCISSPNSLIKNSTMDGPLSPLLAHLRGDEELGLLVVPDASFFPCSVNKSGEVVSMAEELWATLLKHCQEMGNRFLLIDAPRGLHGHLLTGWVKRIKELYIANSSYGAVYYPWLHKGDDLFPPSGHVAGVFARTEWEHEPFGVVWPPANVQVRGVSHTEVQLDWNEIGILGESSINTFVIQPGRGVVLWGARTLSDDTTFQFINARRVVSMVSEQLRRDNDWAVFEQNDQKIWRVLERDIGVRLEEFWRAGLITGETKRGDYEVKCDEETNPTTEREKGTLHISIRLRPIGTMEHITIDLRLGGEN